jgi:hypothetical protein
MEALLQQGWLLVGFVLVGVIFLIAWMRGRDRRWIADRFGQDRIVIMSFGVNYFGRIREAGGPRRSSGFLLLLRDRLFYRSRLTGLELEIPGDRLVRVYPDRSHKGVDLHQSVVKVEFFDEQGRRDAAAFRVPYPPQWIDAIKATLISAEVITPRQPDTTEGPSG